MENGMENKKRGDMLSYLKQFERVIVIALMAMLALTIFLSTIELGRLIVKDIMTPPFLIDVKELLDIFGYFLLVLLGIELIYTLKTYLSDNEIHVEVVFIVALIAIARKVIILDVEELPALTLFGIAAIVIALSAGYYFIKQQLFVGGPKKQIQ
jgi:uncharacterized membrane protein (DUF373 family)